MWSRGHGLALFVFGAERAVDVQDALAVEVEDRELAALVVDGHRAVAGHGRHAVDLAEGLGGAGVEQGDLDAVGGHMNLLEKGFPFLT